MPSKQSPEIDYNGNEVWKYIETSLNPEKIICEGLQESSRIIGCKNFPGYLQLKLKSIDNKNLTLNVFIRKITYDISHKDSIRKITTGSQGNPFKTSRNDSKTTKTFLIGVYVFNEYDDYRTAILVSFPIVEDIKYESNSSLTFPVDLIKKTRLSDNPHQWFNSKKRKFVVFKPLYFDHNIDSIYNVNKSGNYQKPIIQKLPSNVNIQSDLPSKNENSPPPLYLD